MPSLVPRPGSFRPSSASFNRDRHQHRAGRSAHPRGSSSGDVGDRSFPEAVRIHIDHASLQRSAQSLRRWRSRCAAVLTSRRNPVRKDGSDAAGAGGVRRSFRRFGLGPRRSRSARGSRVSFQAGGVLTARLYPKLPTSLRFVAASLRGYQLQRAATVRVRSSSSRKRSSGNAGIRGSGAAGGEAGSSSCSITRPTDVPFYRDHWAKRRRRGDRASPEQLENWPILSKQVASARIPPRSSPSRTPADVRDAHERNDGNAASPVAIARHSRCLVRASRSPDSALERGHASGSMGADGRPARHARRAPPAAVLGLESRHAPALHVELPHHARRRSASTSRRCAATGSDICSVIRRRCTPSPARFSRETSRLRGWRWRSAMPSPCWVTSGRHRRGVSVSGSGHVRAGRNRLRGQRVSAGVDAPLARGRRYGVAARRDR